MAWAKAGSDTLTSAGDVLQITDLTANKFNVFLQHSPYDSSYVNPQITFNNNTNSVYAGRYEYNGGTDGTYTSRANQILDGSGTADDKFMVNYTSSISGEEKLSIIHYMNSGTTGAGNAPNRTQNVWKFVPSPDADITRIDTTNGSAGSYDTGSNLTALGSDITPAAAVSFPTNVQVGSRAEITDSRKMYSFNTPEYKVHTFTSSGTLAITGSGNVEYLVVAGGGSGGGKDFAGNAVGGAGGGAGGFRTNVSGATSGGGASAEATYGVTAQSYTITVGTGGASVPVNTGGIDGGNSSIVPVSGTSIISTGGGGGYETQAGVSNGGSGGGGGLAAETGGLGTSGQGYNGGDGVGSSGFGTGGGGGSGSVGGNGTTTVGGAGGSGTANSITGSSVIYAGGGGGGMYSPSMSAGALGGAGGSGGGGAGGNGSPSNGTDATGYGSGGGGAGGSDSSASPVSGSGSDGIVIVRYVNDGSITATGGTITTTDGVWQEIGA